MEKICVCVYAYSYADDGKSDKLNWYSLDLVPAGGGSQLKEASHKSVRHSCSLMCEIPTDKLSRNGYKFVGVNSSIYVVGGCVKVSRSSPKCTKDIFIIEKESANQYKLETGIPMNGSKGFSSVHAVDGKIYVLPSFIAQCDAPIWAEVFDTYSGKWSNLSQPPHQFLSIPKNIIITHSVFYAKKKKILFYFGHISVGLCGLCSFDVETEQWDCNVYPEMSQIFFSSPFTSLGRHVIIDHIIYAFYKDDLYAYNLEIQGSTEVKVIGLENFTKTVRAHGYDPSYTEVYLFHLDDDKICMVWYLPAYPKSGLRINSLKFNVREEEDGTLNAFEIDLQHCYIPEGTSVRDCLTIGWTLGLAQATWIHGSCQ